MPDKIITLGEIMLRLSPPNFERLMQSPELEATFGGSESNVAISLALFGQEVAYVTALPPNGLGDACIRYVRGYGVDTSFIARTGTRMGVYFLEKGANQRPSSVIYDRASSAIATLPPDGLDWDAILADAGWLHFSGITPAISQSAADLTLRAVQAAHATGVTVSCDYNFRAKLWQYGKQPAEVMREIFPYVNVAILGEQDCRALGVAVDATEIGLMDPALSDDGRKYAALTKKMFATFPNLKVQAITQRNSFSASRNGFSAFLYNGRDFFVGPYYDITDIVDRVGGGDAFAAGLIYGRRTGMADDATLSFAVAAACLKHSIPGDVNLVSVAEVRQLMAGDSSGRVQR